MAPKDAFGSKRGFRFSTPNTTLMNNALNIDIQQNSNFVELVAQAIKVSFRDLILGSERAIYKLFSLHIEDGLSPDSLMVFSAKDGHKAGFGVFETDSPAELIQRVASGLQDHFIEWFMIATPVYSGTSLPLAARVREVAVWEHMTKPELWSCPIGEYPGD
jgi:hypothetical protein